MDRRTLTFSLPTGQRTIKLFTLHPKKPWVAIITHYNTFSLWNYQQKILIKSFSCNTLDESGTVDIRDLIFYDKHCLSYQSIFYSYKKTDESLSNMKSNLIFTTNSKIFFYDYITDGIKQINETEMDKKIIKKVSPYSETKICIGLSDGSMKIYDNKESTKNSMTTRTIRGYHSKPITHLFTYCQSAGESPKVISVSASDGLMACWNIQTIINSSNYSQVWSPSFKLQSQGQGRQQEIKSMQYDQLNYRLLVLTDNFVSIWNTMTGLELRKIKHQLRLKEIYFFDHFSYGHNSFVEFSDGPIVQILKISQSGKMIVLDEINLKNLIKENHLLTIKHIFNWATNPSQLFIETESGLIAIEINASYRPVFGFNNNFVTHLSTFNSKQFVVKGKHETRINPDISRFQAKNAKFQQDALFNSFYLSIEEEWVCFNLVEIQIENVHLCLKKMFHETKKYKFFKPDASSLLYQSQNTQSVIQVSFDGRSLIIFNRAIFYYEIYNAIESQESEDLLNIHQQDSIDFYSKFELITKGACRDIIWHQYKNQFAAICPFDKNGELITFQKDKEKKGIFSRSNKDEQFFIITKRKPLEKILKEADNWCACIFVYTRKTKRYLMVEKSKPIKSHLNRILNLGNIFCYSSQEKNTMETIECISQDQNLVKEIQGIGLFPLKMYLSYCETYQIFVYENYFIVFRMQQNGYLAYHLTVHERVCFMLKVKVMQGMFWQKFFIFSTKNEIYFLQITSTDKVLIKLAESLPNFTMNRNKQAFQSLLIDDLQGEICQTPPGQLQFFTIVNQHLLIVNQYEEITLFPLNLNPYVQFCIELVCGSSESIQKLFRRASNNIQLLMKETLSEYGMAVPCEDLLSTELIY